jgi:hypothetical protein
MKATWFEAQQTCCSMGTTLMILSDAEKYKWMTDIKAIMTSTMNADKSKLVPDSSPSISFIFCFENAHSS